MAIDVKTYAQLAARVYDKKRLVNKMTLPAGVEKMYDAAVVVSSADAHALLASMAAAISETGGNIASVDTLSKSQAGTEGFIEFRFNLNVRDAAHLQAIMAALHTIPQVRKVQRV